MSRLVVVVSKNLEVSCNYESLDSDLNRSIHPWATGTMQMMYFESESLVNG